MKVDIYRNLHNGLWSIRSTGDNPRVLAHAEEVTLYDAKFIVRESGRQRVLREGRKNVHAFVRGNVQHWRGKPFKGRHLFNPHIIVTVNEDFPDWHQASYNPYRLPYFYKVGTSEPVYTAEYAVFTGSKLYVKTFDNG